MVMVKETTDYTDFTDCQIETTITFFNPYNPFNPFNLRNLCNLWLSIHNNPDVTSFHKGGTRLGFGRCVGG